MVNSLKTSSRYLYFLIFSALHSAEYQSVVVITAGSPPAQPNYVVIFLPVAARLSANEFFITLTDVFIGLLIIVTSFSVQFKYSLLVCLISVALFSGHKSGTHQDAVCAVSNTFPRPAYGYAAAYYQRTVFKLRQLGLYLCDDLVPVIARLFELRLVETQQPCRQWPLENEPIRRPVVLLSPRLGYCGRGLFETIWWVSARLCGLTVAGRSLGRLDAGDYHLCAAVYRRLDILAGIVMSPHHGHAYQSLSAAVFTTFRASRHLLLNDPQI